MIVHRLTMTPRTERDRPAISGSPVVQEHRGEPTAYKEQSESYHGVDMSAIPLSRSLQSGEFTTPGLVTIRRRPHRCHRLLHDYPRLAYLRLFLLQCR